MFKHFLKTAFRNIVRNKVFSIINILGLAIGLAGSFFISIYVVNELSYDQCHKKNDRIFRVITEDVERNYSSTRSPYILTKFFKEELPEVESVTQVTGTKITIKLNENVFEERINYATNDLFNIFTIPIILGNKTNPLQELNGLVISEKLAKKLFNKENPIGKTVEIDDAGNSIRFSVTAVMKNLPKNTSFRAEMIGNIELYKDVFIKKFKSFKDLETSWQKRIFSAYLLVDEEKNLANLKSKIADFENRLLADDIHLKFHLQNLKNVYWGSSDLPSIAYYGSRSDIIIFSSIAILILLIAGINYVILSTAKAASRSKEIGVRKVMGASRKALIKQLLGESIILSLLVLPIAYALVELFLPEVSKLFNKDIILVSANSLVYILLFILITLTIGIISGSYIALFISSFKPISAIKNLIGSGNNSFYTRKVLISFQLIIFIVLLICSSIITKQIKYVNNKELGYDNNHLVKIYPKTVLYKNLKSYIEAIKSNPSVINVSYALEGLPYDEPHFNEIPKNDDPLSMVNVQSFAVGYNYLETLNFELIKGRTFSEEYSTDAENAYVINESAVKELGIDDPLTAMVNEKRIIGVVKDFHAYSMREKIAPAIFRISNNYATELIVRISPVDSQETMQYLEEKWKEIFPNEAFSHAWFTDELQSFYETDTQYAKITTTFTLVAVFIACLGLFGLSLFIIEKRMKEIGIRKIHGASIKNILQIINREFTYLVIIASILSWPIAFYFMDKWMQNFEYHISLPLEIYILSGIAALIIVLSTISIRAFKAANSNPVDMIRYE